MASEETSKIQVAAGLIWHENQILVARRPKGDSLGGFWEFPGGKIEANETAEEALKRELREEFGMEVKILKSIGSVEHKYSHAFVELHGFLCEMINYPVLLEAHDELAWVSIEELKKIKLAPADVPFIAKLQQAL